MSTLIDLLKVYVCITHDTLNAKLEPCGFHRISLYMLMDWLIYGVQRSEIGFSSSDYWDITTNNCISFVLSP